MNSTLSNLYKFPKIELHRHLEGSFPLKTLFDLSIKNKLDTPKKFSDFKKTFQFPKNSSPDFLLFLSKFKYFWYRSQEDIYNISYQTVKTFKNDGLFYIELRFSPEHFSVYNNFDRTETSNTVMEACKKAADEDGIDLKFILTFNRTNQTADEMIETYKSFKGLNWDNVVGIDLAGDEINYPPALFKKFFTYIKDEGLYKIDIHAGEVCDSSNIWTAVKDLHADRIGHGISAINDKPLQKYLNEKQIPLCQCITSNYQTGAWADQKTHPIAPLYRTGVPINISSDDPSIQDTDLTEDYEKMIKFFDFTMEEFKESNLKSIDYSFLTDKEKKDLKKRYTKELRKFF